MLAASTAEGAQSMHM
ncbi:hypothetical protein A2U01_0040452, partial [Trifolium medium]|nr:hypothetical protein [Trifolium medium]